MSFSEIDDARLKENPKKRSKKRKEPGGNYDENGESDWRTGRWTPDEMAFCDKLIEEFKAGDLPVANGVKLNDFLATMLKSKQSRLTKKMKNANLSGKIFKVAHGYIADLEACKNFSAVEHAFLLSLSDPQEQATVRFHMQKQWREMFSSFCVSLGQPLDADAWLSSVEEMEKRESLAKDAARMTRRKMMMGIALNQDSQNPDRGVFIEQSVNHDGFSGFYNFCLDQEDLFSILCEKPTGVSTKGKSNNLSGERHYWHYSSPFLGKVISYIQRHGCPFEHVDVWVPSFVPDNDASEGSGSKSTSCRLCFAGFATADVYMPPDGITSAQILSQDEQFNLLSFGDYSQKFSFNVGCGLPGRVYESGIPAWEQSVHNAPHEHFERCGGAIQWGIRTVVGIPVPSPNVGRIVVVLYSRHDRSKDQELVGRLYDEFKKMVPCPKWKLVVDVGKSKAPPLIAPSQQTTSNHIHSDINQVATSGNAAIKINPDKPQGNDEARDSRVDELVQLLGEQMPHDPNSPHASYLQNFMSLRLMLLKPTRTPEEKEVEGILMSSYSSYKASGRASKDIAIMIARDFMFLRQQQHPIINAHVQQHLAPNQNFYSQNQPHHAPGFHALHQAMNMDSSNHSVVGLGRNADANRQQQQQQQQQHGIGIPDVSNHSYTHLIGLARQPQQNSGIPDRLGTSSGSTSHPSYNN
eukprot:CAMPEP_0176477190 /NCGR_PEP_ID=MMETSP0200_2-20121128/479_1 /TAXON_ID=947934 /ORGANISM="Chaetoceros sp., Strain GSL56" /LENGTH=692 /DNA_ID=CAMNT_0017872961 /DNA_START=230 /DNA_END=2305 /DNA_ORIENTATION=+